MTWERFLTVGDIWWIYEENNRGRRGRGPERERIAERNIYQILRNVKYIRLWYVKSDIRKMVRIRNANRKQNGVSKESDGLRGLNCVQIRFAIKLHGRHFLLQTFPVTLTWTSPRPLPCPLIVFG